jgi:hypothetical protein
MKKATKKAARATKSLPVKTVVPRKSLPKKNAAPAPTTAVAVKKKLTPEEEIAKRELEVAIRALEVTEEAEDIARVITSLTIDDVNRERGAVMFRTEVIKVGLKQGHDLLDDIVASAKFTYDTARAKRDKALEPFEAADKTIRDALTIYYTKQRERATLAQKKADDEQRQREHDAAVNRERDRLALEEKIADELAALPDDAPQELLDKIQAPLQVFEQPMQVAPSVKVSAPETTGQMALQSNWKGEVVEGYELVVLKQIVAGQLPLSLVSFNAPELNRMAKLHTDKKRFDGIRFWNQPFTRGAGR